MTLALDEMRELGWDTERLTSKREKEIRDCPGCKDYHREELLAEIDALREERDQLALELQRMPIQNKGQLDEIYR